MPLAAMSRTHDLDQIKPTVVADISAVFKTFLTVASATRLQYLVRAQTGHSALSRL